MLFFFFYFCIYTAAYSIYVMFFCLFFWHIFAIFSVFYFTHFFFICFFLMCFSGGCCTVLHLLYCIYTVLFSFLSWQILYRYQFKKSPRIFPHFCSNFPYFFSLFN